MKNISAIKRQDEATGGGATTGEGPQQGEEPPQWEEPQAYLLQLPQAVRLWQQPPFVGLITGEICKGGNNDFRKASKTEGRSKPAGPGAVLRST